MLLDNKKNGKVGDKLRSHLANGSKLSIISGLFSIYGFESLKKELNHIDALRLILSQNPVNSNLQEAGYVSLAGDRFELRFKNQLNQAQVAKECAFWIKEKAEIRTATNPMAISQNLFHVQEGNGEAIAIQGSSEFTSTGFGYTETDRYHMNTCTASKASTVAMLEWFEAIWNDPAAVQDAKELLLKQLDKLTKDQSPEFIYFLTLYNLFKDFLQDIDEDNIIKVKTGFKETLVWKKLYTFQRDGVLGAIDKIEKYNGCIIADSVGLGKTFEALAVIKYYELRNDRVLVLCPKKIRDNWTVYTVNDKRNLLAKDRFNYDVLNHTDLTRLQGRSGEINLETLNWGNYDLVVIDESHNFRNSSSSSKEGLTRYSRLMNEIILSGVKTKVLMLSATPVNNRMNDLKNQVAFIAEGQDYAYTDFGIVSIEQTLKKAQTRFNQWLRLDDQNRSVEGLLDSMNFDYFKLLDILTIARSRKHIEKYYDIAEIGEFPERLKPINIKEDIDTKRLFPQMVEINRTIRRLNLSAYSPLKYVRTDKREEYNRKYDIEVKGGSIFRQVDREQSLIHLMRVNLFKRMESSINSFGLTLEKLLGEVTRLLEKLENHSSDDIEELGIEDIEVDEPEFDAYLIGKKVKVLIKDMDEVRWKQDLEDDRAKLTELLSEARNIEAERDAKLHRLRTIIEGKCQNPINDGNRKIIVFTAFTDTANYLYDHLANWAKETLAINTAKITGSGTNKTTMPGMGSNFDTLLASFSPISKERNKIDEQATDEIDLMIATDCISEGQNLQDCDYLINYDIHWNPVRIIQRFGRIDRLGSKNKAIQLVNFWPNMELDEYINLEARVSGRMVLLDISATGEENVIEQDNAGKMNDLEYRRKQLQQLKDTVIDLEDISGGVSITDLTLNDFRMDLSEFMKEHLGELEQSPTGLYASTTLNAELQKDELEPGVIFCLKNIGKPVVEDEGYALAPYYLVYITDDGHVKYAFTQSKRILDVLKKHGHGQKLPDEKAIERMSKQTRNGKEMSHYRSLLETAVSSIVGKSEEKGVESLFTRGGTNLTKESFQGMEDFEVISYMIVNAP